jgi:anti-sigma factor RsiW
VTCKESIEFIADYLEGTLPRPQRDEFEKHVAACPYCTEYLDSYRATIDLAGTLREDALNDAPEELVRAILAARKARSE